MLADVRLCVCEYPPSITLRFLFLTRQTSGTEWTAVTSSRFLAAVVEPVSERMSYVQVH